MQVLLAEEQARMHVALLEEKKKIFKQESSKIIEAYIQEQQKKEKVVENINTKVEIEEDNYNEQETIVDDEYSNQIYEEVDELDLEADEEQNDQMIEEEPDISHEDVDMIELDEDVSVVTGYKVNPATITKEDNEITFVLNKSCETPSQITYSILNMDQEKLDDHKQIINVEDHQNYDFEQTIEVGKISLKAKSSDVKLTDFEYESVLQAVKETVESQCGDAQEVKFRIVSREGNMTQVEVELEDESLLVLEIELEEMKKRVSI